MKKNYIFIVACMLLSSNTFAAPPQITTKILEVQNWEGKYFFKIENPDFVNPASCLETEWVVALTSRGRPNVSVENKLVRAREDDTLVTLAIGETNCGFPDENDTASGAVRFPTVRAVIF